MMKKRLDQRGMVFFFTWNNILDPNIDPQNMDGREIDGFFFSPKKKNRHEKVRKK